MTQTTTLTRYPQNNDVSILKYRCKVPLSRHFVIFCLSSNVDYYIFPVTDVPSVFWKYSLSITHKNSHKFKDTQSTFLLWLIFCPLWIVGFHFNYTVVSTTVESTLLITNTILLNSSPEDVRTIKLKNRRKMLEHVFIRS